MSEYKVIQDKIIDYLMSGLSSEVKRATCDTTTKDLCMDSIDHVEFVMFLESEFGIDISDEEGGKINTVGQSVDLVEEKLKEVK